MGNALPTAPGLLVSRQVLEKYGERIRCIGETYGRPLRLHVLPESGAPAPSADALRNIHAAFYSRDIWQGTTMGWQSDASTTFFNMVNAAPDLQWLHLISAGVDLVQFPQYSESLERGLRLSTSSGSNALPIAHTVVAAVLAHARGFLHWAQAQSEGRWSPLPSQELPRDLSEQTVIIIGMGPIGREVGRLLNTVGMRTVGIRRNVGQAPHFDAVYHYDDLDGLLPEASFVILACPLTDETRGLLNAARLARLSPSASLVNVGRGELVDEAALVDALAARRLRSAYLDVFQVEPLLADSPLWRLPNVWISPHNSSAAEGNVRRVAEIFLDNLKFWLNGERLTNEVTVPPKA